MDNLFNFRYIAMVSLQHQRSTTNLDNLTTKLKTLTILKNAFALIDGIANTFTLDKLKDGTNQAEGVGIRVFENGATQYLNNLNNI